MLATPQSVTIFLTERTGEALSEASAASAMACLAVSKTHRSDGAVPSGAWRRGARDADGRSLRAVRQARLRAGAARRRGHAGGIGRRRPRRAELVDEAAVGHLDVGIGEDIAAGSLDLRDDSLGDT